MKSAWLSGLVLASCAAPPLAGLDDSSATTAADSTSGGSTVADGTTATPTTTTTTTASTSDGDATTADAPCDPDATACTGGQAWLRAFPVTGDGFLGNPIEASMLAIAANGDIVASGLYGGTIAFGEESIASIGALDVWVARFAPDGAPQWFRRFGGPDPTPNDSYAGANWSAGNIAFAANGDILVSTRCVDTIDLGFGPLVGDDLDAVLLRLSAAGEPKWGHRYVGLGGGISGPFPLFVAPIADDRLWLAGTLYGKGIDLGDGTLYSAGWGDVLLAQVDGDGEHLWSRRAGDPGHQEVRAIAATTDGGLVIAGGIEGSLDLGNGPLTSAGTRDAFVARLDAAGEPTWAHRYGDSRVQSSLAVRVDNAGEVVLVGTFESTIDLGGGPFVSPKVEKEFFPEETVWASGVFLAQLASDGGHMWSSALLPDDGGVWLASFDRGSDGTLVLAGGAAASLQFPGEVSGSGVGAWVGTLGPGASPRWQRILLDDEYSSARAVAGPQGAAVVALTIYGEVEFDGVNVGIPDQESLVLAQFGL